MRGGSNVAASKAKQALPHLEQCAHHFTLAARAMVAYVAALGGVVPHEDQAVEPAKAKARKAPPKAKDSGAPKAAKSNARRPKVAPADPTPAPQVDDQPGLWGAN
jgi:hypothetical protein